MLSLLVLLPEASRAEPSNPDIAAVAHYLAAGHPLPAWAKSERSLDAMSIEARAHGLQNYVERALGGVPGDEVAFIAALRLARGVVSQAVTPTSVQRDWTIADSRFDVDAALVSLAHTEDPISWIRAQAPQTEEYVGLQRALERYGAIARGGGWPPVPPGPTLKPGTPDPRVPILRRRLAIEGLLPLKATEGDDSDDDDATVQAVARFQRQHGLAPDGVVGRETLAELNIGARMRYWQIAANLERWRWLPRDLPKRRIMVNAADAELRLFEPGQPPLALRTVVGTRRHPTPALAAAIVSLLLNPPWDIPTSITKREIRPRVRREPGYLARERIVPRDDGRRLRQLPGPENALGRLKFEMPNPLDVYLHDTPNKELFARPRRFFSHGCIRVEHPQRLALRLLQGQPSWNETVLEQAIAAGETRRITLVRKAPIYVVYFTAFVDDTGAVAFRDDIYDRDPPLIAALRSPNGFEPPAAHGDGR